MNTHRQRLGGGSLPLVARPGSSRNRIQTLAIWFRSLSARPAAAKIGYRIPEPSLPLRSCVLAAGGTIVTKLMI